MKQNKLGARFWISVLLVGVIGQLAWAIENNYINLWVYSQTGNADAITWMTISSSIAATLTTFFIGLLSDRLGKRKLFINVGYIIWGLSVFSFGLFSYHNMLEITKDQASAILLVGIFMTVMDNVMTFFGSSSNDAAFNAWLTEHTDSSNRGKVESVVSILPLLANVMMMGIGLPLHIGSSTNGDDYLNGLIQIGTYKDSQEALAHGWFLYFLICGVIVAIIGVISIFLLPKDNCVPNREG
ncbi:MAG: MFS transporter, partial [Bacilli bacterium]|nr:MFS transporter [Bacilli bacterium]